MSGEESIDIVEVLLEKYLGAITIRADCGRVPLIVFST